MNVVDLSLEVLKLSIAGERHQSTEPSQNVKEIMNLLRKIHEEVSEIDKTLIPQDCPEPDKFRKAVVEVLRITLLNEELQEVELSGKIYKILTLLREIYSQAPTIIVEPKNPPASSEAANPIDLEMPLDRGKVNVEAIVDVMKKNDPLNPGEIDDWMPTKNDPLNPVEKKIDGKNP